MEVIAGLINFWCSVVVQRGLTHFAYVGCLGELTPFWYISRSQKYYSAAVPLTDSFYKSDYPPKFYHHYESSYYWCCRVGPFVYLFVHTEGIPSPCSSRRNTLDCCNLEIWKPFKLPVFKTGVVVLVNYRTVVLTTRIDLLNIVFAINAKSKVVNV